MSKVFIGVGHGGKDPGAIGNGFKEKDLTLVISKYCASALKRCGVQYKMSRTTDTDPVDTVAKCNKYKPDVAVAIHLNAFNKEAIGTEVYHSKFSQKGTVLASYVLNSIISLGVKSRGSKTKINSSGKDYFEFIRETEAPAILVECCFIDSTDIKFVNTKAKQKAMGEAIAKGICEYLNVKYITEQPKTKVPGKTYKVQVGAFTEKQNAENLLKQLKEKGFNGFITEG
jgi:N-acetylmuramoyl-L-alanine amidase